MERKGEAPGAALEVLGEAVQRTPNDAAAMLDYGIALAGLARLDEAHAAFRKAEAVAAANVEALHDHSELLRQARHLTAALGNYNTALRVTPDEGALRRSCGDAFRKLNRFNDSLRSYDRALGIAPDADTLISRSIVLRQLNRFQEALAGLELALTWEPDNPRALGIRASILLLQGKIEDSISDYRRALAIQPDWAWLHTNLIFALNFDLSATAADKQSERARWNERHARRFADGIAPHTNERDPERRLRVGYVSAQFRHHAASLAFGGVIVEHDPREIEVFCYSDSTVEDAITGRFRSRAQGWQRTAGLSDQELADLIREDRIDILVDLVGHMRGNRLLTFARKPAPIQVTAWGEPTGTGLSTMDYLFADAILVSETERALLAEEVVALPNFIGYWQPDPLPGPEPLPALTAGHLTFGSFNRLQKISRPALELWASILRKLPDAQLLMKTRALGDAAERERIRAVFRAADVDPGRLTLSGFTDRDSHFEAYRKVDIALDSFPHSGGMTTLDSLWMGVPVVTWAGETVSSRLTAACLSASGLTDYVAHSPTTYAELAIARASDLNALSQLRAGLRAKLESSEFGDNVRYSRAVERAYREMWRRWCAQQVRR